MPAALRIGQLGSQPRWRVRSFHGSCQRQGWPIASPKAEKAASPSEAAAFRAVDHSVGVSRSGCPVKGKNGTTFTLRFTDQAHQVVTEQTQEVMQAQPVYPGDRIQVYVPADPSDVTDVRFGAPGRYDFSMAEMFFGLAVTGWTVIALVAVRRKRRFATMAYGLTEIQPKSRNPRRATARRDGVAQLDDLLDRDDD